MNSATRCARGASIGTGLLGFWLGLVLLGSLSLAPGVAKAQPSRQAETPPPAPPQVPAPPNYRFRQHTALKSVPLSPGILNDEDRSFLASLPELRVAVPLPPTRPYEHISPDGEVSGIHPDMLLALASTFGLRLKPVVLPDWTSVLQAARARQVDIVMTLGVTNERLEYLAFTLGATPLPGALFAKNGTRVDLQRARFALERDYMTNDWVRRQYPHAQIVSVSTTGQALRAVAEDRADYYLGSLLEASDVLSQEPAPGVEVNRSLNYGTGYYHFGVRKDWARLAAILNKGLHSLRATSPNALAAVLSLPGTALPPGMRLPSVLTLPTEEARLLAGQSVWRVGAVRGLNLLNDVDERGLHSGIAAEYTEQVAQRLGVAVQIVPFASVASMLDGLRRGDIDIVPFLTQTPERAREFAYSEPYVEMPYVIVARRDKPHYWDLNSLRGKSLALAPQHPLREIIERHYPEIRVLEAASGGGAMDMVESGEADAAVEVRVFANLRVNASRGEQLRVVAEVRELPAQFHFATLHAQRALLSLVNRALGDIDGGERQRMLRRWVAVDAVPAISWRRYAPALAVAAAALLLMVVGTSWWMHRLRREVQARRRSEELLNDIAATVPGLAFRYVMGAAGELKRTYLTPGAPALLGRELSDTQTVLASINDDLEPEDRERAWAEQLRCMASGDRFKMTCRYHHPDGRLLWLHAEAVQTRAGHTDPVWTGYLVDVTTEKELQGRLSAEAESRNLMLASASHELRAPTHALSLALQSLSTHGLDDAQMLAVQVAQESARTLAELLNDVLDAARSGPDALQLRARTFDLHRLLDDLAGAWRAAARTKGLGFDLQIDPSVPQTIVTDPLRLKQVLINLLSNACKYTREGHVSLSASLSADRTLRLQVADTGSGMSQADLARVGKPYVTLQPTDGAVVSEGSSGLGLATCHRIAGLLSAQLDVQSTPGHGTRATLTLPLREAAPVVPTQGAVVVCDDDDTSRMLMGLILRRHGFQTQEVERADRALELWRQGQVSAIVTDLDLPGQSGMDLLQILRAEERQSGSGRTVVIVCSGSPAPSVDDAQSAALYDAYLVKPVNVALLAQTLRRLGLLPAAVGLAG